MWQYYLVILANNDWLALHRMLNQILEALQVAFGKIGQSPIWPSPSRRPCLRGPQQWPNNLHICAKLVVEI